MSMLWIICICVGFLLGSVLFSRIIACRFGKKDIILLSADRNPGAANVFSQCGKRLGTAALLLDIGKGTLPVLLAVLCLPTESLLFSLVTVAPVLGHALGIFDRLQGGKCIATSFGVLIGLLPVTRIGFLLAALYILFSTVCRIPSHTTRSILTFSLFAVGASLLLRGTPSLAIGCVLLSLLAIIKHVLPAIKSRKEHPHDRTEPPA